MAATALELNIPYFSFNEIKLEKRIGRGNASVYHAMMSGHEIAVKKMDCDKEDIPREVKVQATLPPHPNILPLLGVAHGRDGFTLYICMELADKSLHQYLHTEKNMPSLQQSLSWALQIARGMQHIHEYGLAHRDLKSANILLYEKRGVLKVCDFGTTRPLDHTTVQTGMTGTCRWMAPEFHDKATTGVNQRCDVFSFAMVLYELFVHELPFSQFNDGYDILPTIRGGIRPPLPCGLPNYMDRLVRLCWRHKSHDRPTFEEIIQILETGRTPPTPDHQRRDQSHSPTHPCTLEIASIYPSELSFYEEEFYERGTFGDVRKARWKEREVAVKLFSGVDRRGGISEEIAGISLVHGHPHIICLYGAHVRATSALDRPFIVMEFAQYSLGKVLHEHCNLIYTADHVMNWSIQMVTAFQFMHSKGVLHRDIKPSNILLFKNGRILKLCDFGTARVLQHTLTNAVGTVWYMAPEVIRGTNYTASCDVYSFGVVLWEMITRHQPYLAGSKGKKLASPSVLYKVATGSRLPMISDLPRCFIDLLNLCWSEDCDKRPTMEQIRTKLTKLSERANLHLDIPLIPKRRHTVNTWAKKKLVPLDLDATQERPPMLTQ